MANVPYRSAGSHRRLMMGALSTVGTRATGRPIFFATPRDEIKPLSGLGSLGCCPNCTDVPYDQAKQQRLGALGASALVGSAATGALGKGAAIGATSLLSFAGAGSFAGPVGAVVGVVVGILSQKLFGHADYARVASDVATSLKYAEAYKQVMGQYPGRLYGIDELKQVWSGVMHEGVFPKNHSGWAPGASCNISACINGVRDRNGNCPGCGGSQAWLDDVFATGNSSQQTFWGALRAGNAQGLQNPIQIADSVLIPAWSGPDQGSKNIKWASPANSTNAGLVRQLMIDTLDAMSYAQNPSLPVFYGSVPSAAPPPPNTPVAPPPPVASVAPPPAQQVANPTCAPGYWWNGTQCAQPIVGTPTPAVPAVQAPNSPAQSPCRLPYVWNGTQCVYPSTPTLVTSPPASTAPAGPPAGFVIVGGDANGNPVYANPQGVLYVWTGSAMQLFAGQLASGSSSAAQMQAALQNALAQGQSAQQAAAAALNQAQSAGVAVTPQLQQQVAAQTDATASAPVQATTAGFTLGGTAGILAIGVTVVGLLFASRGGRKRRG